MNRRNRTLIVMGIAVVLATLASYAVYVSISRMPVREVEVATTHVVVAAENLPMGTRISKEHVKVIGWPSSSPVQGSFAAPDALIGRGLIQSIASNEPLTEGKLAPIEAGAGLPPAITPGMRAMSVRVNNVTGVAGFTLPGTRVDVLVTMSEGDRGNMLTRAVVSNLQVLTADTRYDVEQAKEGNAMPSSVVTLLVTPEDAERITLAQSTGQITLVLRNPLDMVPTDTKGARMANLLGTPPAPPVVRPGAGGRPRAVTPQRKVDEVPAPPVYVEAFRGGKKSNETVEIKKSGAGGEGQ